MAENMDGYFSLDDQRIAVREGMSEVQTVCAAVHEIAHSKLHNKDEIGEKYQGIELFDKPALFSNGRIDRDKRRRDCSATTCAAQTTIPVCP